MTTKVVPIYKSELEEVFRYDPATNILERKFKSGSWKIVKVKPKSNGYFDVRFKGRLVLIHRLIWTLVNGNIPGEMHVDHLDNNPANNNIKNLQLLSNRDNIAKSVSGLKPRLDKRFGTYYVMESVCFGEERPSFYFGSFKLLCVAQKLCDAYNTLFGYGKPQYSARTGSPKHWRSCMNNFKDSYFN